MSFEWTNRSTLEFLELYQNEPVLWEPMHPYHKDKKHLNDAWVRLSEAMEMPITELKRKKDSLMATFRSHLRRKKGSFKSGASASGIYKPVWFAYDIMEAFLGSIYECNTTVNTQDVVEPESAGEESQIDNENNQENEEPIVTQETTIMPATIITTPTASSSRFVTASASKASQQTVRRRSNPPELVKAGRQMKEAFNMLHDVVNKKTIQEDDECDLFAKILAKRLRKLPENERQVMMYDIDGLFVNNIHQLNRLPPSNSSFSSPYVSPRHSPQFSLGATTELLLPRQCGIAHAKPSSVDPVFNYQSTPSRPSSSASLPYIRTRPASTSSSLSEPAYSSSAQWSMSDVPAHTPAPRLTVLSDVQVHAPTDIVSQAFQEATDNEYIP
ncbi:hypothetical protein NQ315_003192 [Exocentrus adspersus]|uniref:MADF domain-containing protein n=1 Tax=Exocentrus adspersus TaxID=1586481 RepID=A0AAV8VNN5_9CUCU|nr:hypothetical protein NQ315_003192 [Exocentrus adspersus]